MTAFWMIVAGWANRAGAVATTRAAAVTTDDAAKRPAARAPSRDQNMAASTGPSGHAVTFSAHAAPRTSPARTAQEGRAARASASSMSASTGGSVVITARLSAITGEDTAKAVYRRMSRRH